jgi:Zn finger protein HypA/HybF involved in hydrogenase expression
MRGKHEPVQLVCPKCRYRTIVYLPLPDDEDLPICPECKQARMNIEELLDEGKSY